MALDGIVLAKDFASGSNFGHSQFVSSLALAIAETIPQPNHPVWRLTVVGFLSATADVVSAQPDAPLFATACHVATRLVDMSADDSQRATGLISAGLLHLEPFAASPFYDSYDVQLARLNLLSQVHHSVGVGHQLGDMPDSTASLRTAADLLTKAIPFVGGSLRALTLANRAYARFSLHQTGELLDQASIIEDLREARSLVLVDPLAQARALWATVCLGLVGLDPQTVQLPDSEQLIRLCGVRKAAIIVNVLSRVFAQRARDVTTRLRARLLSDFPFDLLQFERNMLELQVAHFLEHDPLDCIAASTMPLKALLTTTPNGWSQEELADGALHVTRHIDVATSGDYADIERVLNIQPTDLQRAALVRRIRVDHIVANALQKHRDHNYVVSAPLLVGAAVADARLGFHERAIHDLELVLESIVRGSPEAAMAAVPALVENADILLALLAYTSANDITHRMYGQIFTRISELASPGLVPKGSQNELVNNVVLVMQLAKGRALANAQARSGPQSDDNFVARVLKQESDIAERLGVGADLRKMHEWSDSELFDDESFLGAQWHSEEAQVESGLLGALINLRRRYQLVDQLRCSSQGAAGFVLYSAEEVTNSLPNDAVLISFFHWGVGEPPLDGFHCFVSTSDTTRCLCVYDPAVAPITSIEIVQWHDGAPPAGGIHGTNAYITSYVRRCLSDDPLHREASRNALDSLFRFAGYFQPVLKLLEHLRASGRSHIVLWPHGAHHNMPFHLMPTYDGGIIADHWTVTQIPNLQSVMRHSLREKQDGLTAFASARGGEPYGLPPVPSVVEQAEVVARLFGVHAFAFATRDQFRRRAPQARYIHIAAHGEFYHAAPLFHCLYFDDGPFYAHDILKLDLRSVELVTVSACESALLRHDANDNLLGMPAAFLRAGVASVVGAMWPVEVSTASDFFVTLYGYLAAGEGKLRAFRAAQTQTRSSHPSYRDWGAFCMLGDWRDPSSET